MKMIWCGWYIEENYCVFVEEFHRNLPSKTVSCEKKVCFQWCKMMLYCIVRASRVLIPILTCYICIASHLVCIQRGMWIYSPTKVNNSSCLVTVVCLCTTVYIMVQRNTLLNVKYEMLPNRNYGNSIATADKTHSVMRWMTDVFTSKLWSFTTFNFFSFGTKVGENYLAFSNRRPIILKACWLKEVLLKR